MKKELLKATGSFLLVVGIAACNNAGDNEKTSNDSNMKNQAGAHIESANADPVSLFDGKSLAGWHGFNKKGEVKNWTIEDGAMVCLGAAPDAEGGDLVSDKDYENFELTWDWKVTKGGNSGVMYHVVESPEYKTPYETGPEYQMIDDIGFPGKLEEWQKSGADYAMYTANDKKKLNPVGEWNASKIVFDKGHVEYWLNGEKIIAFQAWDDVWKKKVKEGKWKDYPGYGKKKTGKIALQDHGKKVYFKNILIKEL